VIRPATVGDAPRIAEIFVAAWRSGYRGVVADEVIDALDVSAWTASFRKLLQPGDFSSVVWCAENGDLLGFSRFGPDPERPRPDAGYLASLYVDPSVAGQGVGRALLDDAVEKMAAAGRARLTLWVFGGNHRARNLYERAGFTATGERRTDPRWGAEQLLYRRVEDRTATPKARVMPVSPEP
jgi:ribosomal protein S18 acetylase RimI-like enzyme